MFREHGCELPANAMFEHTNTRYPQTIRCVRLPSELREPIEKSACLATIVRATAYLAGLGQRDISAAKQQPDHVLQYLLFVLSDFRTQFVPGLCPQEQCRADHPSDRK